MSAARRRGEPRLVTPLFLLVMSSTFAYFVSIGVLIPTLPRYVEGPLSSGDFAVGAVVGSFSLAAVLVRPVMGTVGDRRGRALLIVGGGTIVALSTAAYAFADSIALLLALRIVSGLGEAAFYTGGASVITDLAPDARRGEAVSLFSLALFAGLAVGPVLGEAVLAGAGYTPTWLVAAAAAGVAAGLGLWVPETRPAASPSTGAPVRIVHPAALLPGVILACSIWGLAGYNAFVPLYALQVGLDGSRGVFALYSVIVIAIRSVGARIPDRLGPSRTARLALALSAVGLGVIAAWGDAAGLVAGTVLMSIGQALTFPALMTVALARAPAAERGSVVGTFTAFFDLAFGAGSVTLGGVAALTGYRGTFAAAAVVALLGMALLVRRARRARRDGATAVERAA